MNVGPDETIDELRRHNLHILQKRQGYRFSLDPLLLADFVELHDGDRVLDLGTGCGIIPLLLASRCHITVCGVDHQAAMAELAGRNVAGNSLGSRVRILHKDILDLRDAFPVSSFDLVTANPPYRKPGTGRVSPLAGRDQARHESTAGLADFLSVGKYLVKPGGRIAFIYHPLRLAELLSVAAELKLAPLRMRLVHDSLTAEARMVLVSLAKGSRGSLKILPPLLIRGENGAYSSELQRIFGGE